MSSSRPGVPQERARSRGSSSYFFKQEKESFKEEIISFGREFHRLTRPGIRSYRPRDTRARSLVINRPSTSNSPQSTPTSQKITPAQLQLKGFKSVFEAHLDESDLTDTQKLEFKRHVEEMKKMLQDLEE